MSVASVALVVSVVSSFELQSLTKVTARNSEWGSAIKNVIGEVVHWRPVWVCVCGGGGCVYVCMYVYVCAVCGVYVYMCVCGVCVVCVHKCMHVYVCVCVYVCVQGYVYVCV